MKNHLGGHGNKTNLEEGSIIYLKKKFNIKNLIDIGCSRGNIIDICNNIGIDAYGIEGDEKIINKSLFKHKIYLHDFTKCKFKKKLYFDLGYSTEFLEHVEEKYMNNYMVVFEKCKYILFTAAPVKWTGIHHVNCQNNDYWIKQFNKRGFIVDPYITLKCREKSTMNINAKSHRQFIKMRGIFMINTRYIPKLKLYKKINDNEIKENRYILLNNYKFKENKKMTVTIVNMNKETVTFISELPLISYIGSEEEAIKELKCDLNII